MTIYLQRGNFWKPNRVSLPNHFYLLMLITSGKIRWHPLLLPFLWYNSAAVQQTELDNTWSLQMRSGYATQIACWSRLT